MLLGFPSGNGCGIEQLWSEEWSGRPPVRREAWSEEVSGRTASTRSSPCLRSDGKHPVQSVSPVGRQAPGPVRRCLSDIYVKRRLRPSEVSRKIFLLLSQRKFTPFVVQTTITPWCIKLVCLSWCVSSGYFFLMSTSWLSSCVLFL